jgi:leucyl-tRNA synthetase
VFLRSVNSDTIVMEYQFDKIEKKWQQFWAQNQTFKTDSGTEKPKYYILDMFPYPSGAGLHVGHPLGYIASDIFARYKRAKGFNVLHPMGYDSFGLPAEQYAIQTGQHPSITTEENIERYRQQLDAIGFSFDWSREVRTSDPGYYRHTQWIFIQLFNSWFNKKSGKAEKIETMLSHFTAHGNQGIDAACDTCASFTADEWNEMSEIQQQQILLQYRLAYLAETAVNWCPKLGTVLANEEVKDGLSERGGFPVEKKLMKQWSMRITAYADRLLDDLEGLEWSDAIKEVQRNWIGRSEGALIKFTTVEGSTIEVFTTRPDTIFGVSFLTLAPEHPLVEKIVTADKKEAVEKYIITAKNRSERERMADVKNISGEFTGAYAKHPFTGKDIPIWIGDYVLSGYGTGAVMAVPAHDSRDFAFAHFFKLPILEVVKGGNISNEAYEGKEGVLINSDFLNNLTVKEAIKSAIHEIEIKGFGQGKKNFRMRDAIFSRQRYWGEPIPVYYKEGLPYTLNESDLPLRLPEVDAYIPTENGEPPLARAKNWVTEEGFPLETNTMPGWAGSSWYFLRYMDPENTNLLASPNALNYWQDIDLYLGGAEHGTGHLLYVRFWTKFLFDLGYIPKNEPAKKLINQGMIQGVSSLAYKINDPKGGTVFISKNRINSYPNITPFHVSIDLVRNDVLDIEAFKKWRPEYVDSGFVLEEDGQFLCGSEVEKMSKSKWNVVNPDDVVNKYGADTLRLYEMFLGPLEMAKPWNTNGISGVYNFLRKLWRLFHDSGQNFYVASEEPLKEELKVLHKTIKKVQEDIERFSFNTSVSTFMICVNELLDLKCNKRAILEPLTVLIAPYAPHIAEELWALLGHTESISQFPFPDYSEKYLTEAEFDYPVSFNGRTRCKINLPLTLSKEAIEEKVIAFEEVQKWLNGVVPKKIIVVPGKIVNIVV